MLSPALLVTSVVDMLRLIPELVTELGSADRIYGYIDQFPDRVDAQTAIGRMTNNSLMVMWRGTAPGTFARNNEVWKHRLALIVRAADPTAVWVLVVNGVPSDSNERFTRREPHPACYPPDTPSIERRSLLIGQETVLDYFEISVVYTEKGDF